MSIIYTSRRTLRHPAAEIGREEGVTDPHYYATRVFQLAVPSRGQRGWSVVYEVSLSDRQALVAARAAWETTPEWMRGPRPRPIRPYLGR